MCLLAVTVTTSAKNTCFFETHVMSVERNASVHPHISLVCVLTMRLHTAPCLLCLSGVRRTWSVVTMASPISSQWEEPKDPTPEDTNSTVIMRKSWQGAMGEQRGSALLLNKTSEKVDKALKQRYFNEAQWKVLNVGGCVWVLEH